MIVDDHPVDQEAQHVAPRMSESIRQFINRPGPVLRIGPDKHIGLTQPIAGRSLHVRGSPRVSSIPCKLRPGRVKSSRFSSGSCRRPVWCLMNSIASAIR